jgi:hypothetical protein
MKILMIIFAVWATTASFGQSTESVDSLKTEILKLRQDIDHVKVNLGTSENKFKRGILVATLGYTVTITGGLMLGRKQDQLGKVLLVAGGATGVVGTALMIDSFKYLGRAGRARD